MNVEYRSADRVIEACLIFLLVFTPLALGTVQPWSIFIMRMLVVVALVTWVIKIFKSIGRLPEKSASQQTKKLRNLSTVEIFLILFLIAALISTFTSIYKYESFETFANLLVYASVFFLITHNITTQKQIKRLTTAILLTSFILGVYGLLQYFDILRLTPSITIPRRVSSTYYNSNHFAGYLAMVTPIPVALFLFSRFSWKSILFAALSVLLLINLALSYSWGSVAFGIAIIFLVIMRIKQSGRRVLMAAVAIGVLVSFAILGALIMLGPTPQLPQSTWGERYINMAKIANPSLFGRFSLYKKIIPLILNHPALGAGPGTFIYVFTLYRPVHPVYFWNYAHNDYLQIASEMGLIGLSFFLIFVTAVLAKGIKNIKLTSGSYHIIVIGAWTGILAALLYSVLDGNLSVVPANALYFYVLMGLLIISIPNTTDQLAN